MNSRYGCFHKLGGPILGDPSLDRSMLGASYCCASSLVNTMASHSYNIAMIVYTSSM